MNVKFLNPFVDAAFEVLQFETGFQLARGDLRLEKDAYVTDDVTVIISMVGRVCGNVFYSMSKDTAMNLASGILGESLAQFDTLAQSGIAELSNVITGRASVKLAKAGYEATISPPALLIGKGATISTLDFARLVVPMAGQCGPLLIHLALRESAQADFSAAQTPVAQQPNFS